jgi:hypothetical protein
MKLKSILPWQVLLVLIGVAAYFGWIWYSGIVNGGSGRWERAPLDVKSFDQAATAYYMRHSQWPPSLETLFQPQSNGEPPLLKHPEALIDPGGQPYQYDVNQVNPKTDKPLIWSEGPNPNALQIRITTASQKGLVG